MADKLNYLPFLYLKLTIDMSFCQCESHYSLLILCHYVFPPHFIPSTLLSNSSTLATIRRCSERGGRAKGKTTIFSRDIFG